MPEYTWELARELIGDLDSEMLYWLIDLLPDGSDLSALAPKSMRSDIARGHPRRIERYEIPVRVLDHTITNRAAGEPEAIRLVTLDHRP